MDKEQALNIARRYKELVIAHFPVKALYLYGSYSKGSQNENSDIDIAIIVEKMSDDFFTDMPLLWKLRRKISNLIEPVLLLDKEDDPLYGEIIKTGILV